MNARFLATIVAAVCLLAAALVSPAAGEQVLTTLRAANPSPVARPAVPISCGVPLPAETASDETLLALRDGDVEIPAQFAPMVRVPTPGREAKFIRWVQVDAVLDLPARGTRKVDLVLLDAHRPRGPLLAREDDRRITVATGPLTFMVNKKGVNGAIDQAWLSPAGDGAIDPDYHVFDSSMLLTNPPGPSLAEPGGTVHRAAGGEGQAVLERNGSLAATIRVSGSMASPAGRSPIDYVVRMTAYRGLAVLRVQFTWLKRQGGRQDVIEFSRVGYDLPTVLPGEKFSVQFGGAAQVHSGELSDKSETPEAFIAHDEPDRYLLGGAMVGNGPGRGEDVTTTGWASVDNGKVGLAAGRRWFWQMAPADVTVRAAPASGGWPTVELGLRSARAAAPFRSYTGMGRSHEVYLALFAAADRGQLADRMRDLTEPVLLAAEPAYYCLAAQPAGPLMPTDPARLAADELKAAKLFDRQMSLMLDWVAFNREKVAGVSGFGYRFFGDFPVGRVGEGAEQVRWAANPNDFPHANFVQWLRTGEAKYFDAFYASAGQLLDSHTVLADPDAASVGATRYAPGEDQAMYRGRPFVSPTFAFLHVQGMVERALVSADPWALQVAWASMERAFTYAEADGQFNEPASPGNQMLALVSAYRLSGDAKYLQRCAKIVAAARRFQDRYDGLYFPVPDRIGQTAVTCEGMLEYYLAGGDRDAVDSVRRHLKALLDKKLLDDPAVRDTAQAFAYPLAFLSIMDLDPLWRRKAVELIGTLRPRDSLEDLSLSCRGVGRAIYFLSDRGPNDPVFARSEP